MGGSLAFYDSHFLSEIAAPTPSLGLNTECRSQADRDVLLPGGACVGRAPALGGLSLEDGAAFEEAAGDVLLEEA